MKLRRRFKQEVALQDRLASFAKHMREEAAKAKPGPERESLLMRARQADTAQHLDDWANSPGLQRPT